MNEWESRMWNAIATHPDIQSDELLLSRRDEIATYVIPEVDTMIGELVRCFAGQGDRWNNDHEVELLECYDCGVRSPDEDHYQYINREKPSFNYPGYDGDLVCAACAEGHTEWYKEH